MAVVPFVFANRSGSIPLSELDVNFANVKAFAETAGNITGNVQPNITAVGTLTLLNVSGNLTANIINSNGNITTSSAVSANVIIATSGNIGTASNVTIFRLANNFPTTFFIGGNASNVYIGNVNSTTRIAGNITAGGDISAVGNIIGNGGLITGVTRLVNGISFANIPVANGNVQISSNGNTWTFDTTGNIVFPTGGVLRSKLNSGNVGIALFESNANGEVSMNWANNNFIYVDSTGSYLQSFGNAVQLNGNLLSVGTSSTVAISATGNVQGANVRSLGVVFGNVCLLTPGFVSAAGNAIVGGNLSVSGNASAPTAANGTNTTQLATTAFVLNTVASSVPTGVIVMWSGNIASVPTGWSLCNGGNGTPDLRDRFIVGAGNVYAVAAVGGSANAIVVDHTHSATSVVTDPGHAHSYTAPSGTDNSGVSGSNVVDTTVSSTTGTANTGITVATTVTSTGSSATNANLPPYYALAYIMKL
jgi:hypothetical protein